MLVVGHWTSCLSRKKPTSLNKHQILADDRAATAGGHDLVAVEGENPDLAKTTCWLTVEGGTQRLCGVLDQGDFVLATERADALHVGHRPVQVNGQDSCWQLANVCSPAEFVGQQVWIELPGDVDVDEAWPGANIGHRKGGRGERGRWHEHIVTWSNAYGEQGEVQRRGTAAECNCTWSTRYRSEFLLEGIQVGPGWGDPARIKGVE